MNRILFIYEREMPTVSELRLSFMKIDGKFGFNSIFCKMDHVKKEDLEGADILFLIRPNSTYAKKMISMTKKAGKFVIVFYDDDLLNLPMSLPTIPWRKKAIISCIQNCDVVLSTNHFIGRKFASIMEKPRYAIINTAVSTESLKDIELVEHDRFKKVVKIVYAAGANHLALFNKYVLPIIPRLAERYGEKISLTFMGMYPDLEMLKNTIEVNCIASMPLIEFREALAKGNYDIGLAPLNEDDFSRSKYYNKFIEYSKAGIVGIYTKVEPYTFIVRNCENGCLTSNNPEDWYETLCELIDNHELRMKCLEGAYRTIKTVLNPDAIYNKLITDIPELTYKRHNGSKISSLFCPKLIYKLNRIGDWIFLLYFYLKNKGVKGVVEKTIIHIKGTRVFK